MELKAQREDQANLTADVTGLLVQMQRDRDLAAARRRKDELRMTIGAVGQGIEVLASIAFATNPETRDKIIAGSRAAVTVLDSATILSDSAASNGEQAIATMNIYGAFFQLGMILWGPEREDPIAHNFRVLIVGLQNLHKHVDRRFDRLEGLMLAATKQLNDRFDQVEVKLSDLRQKVVQLHEQAAINAGLAKSYLTYLSSRDFKVKQRNCFQGLTSLELTLREYGTCLSTFLDHALEFSEIDAATGRAVYAPALTDASLAATLVAPAALYDVGLLFAALENAAARLNSDLTLARLNPSTWVDGARAYNNILKRAVADAPRLSRKPQQIVTEEAANVRDIVNGGHRLNESVSLVSAECAAAVYETL